MDSIEIQKLYKETFGSVKDDEKSLTAFIELLKRFELIDDDTYFWQKQNLSTGKIVESFSEYVPMFEFFDGEDKEERAYFDIKKKLGKCNTIYVIPDNEDEETETKFVKTYDAMGIPKWINLSEDDDYEEYDDDFIIGEIKKYINDGYTLETHGKFIDLCRKKGEIYFNVEELKRKLDKFYNIIFGSDPVLDEDWPTFLDYAKKAGIITDEQKIMLDKDVEDKHKDKTGEKEDGDVPDENK